MRINISVDDKLLKEVDEYCETFNINRSEMIRAAVRQLLYVGNSLIKKMDGGEILDGISTVRDITPKEEPLLKKIPLIVDSLTHAPLINKFVLCKKHGGYKSTCGCE